MTAPRRNILLGAAVLIALLLAFIVPNFRRGVASLSHPDPIGPTAYSRSAIGHLAFYQLLLELDIPVEISENGSGAHVGPHDVLLVAEPRTDPTTLAEVKVMLDARTVLLVLPKRKGKPDSDRPYWLAHDTLIAEADVNALLHLVDPNASIARVASVSEFTADKSLSGGPSIHKPQVIQSKLLRPLLAAKEGILIGERRAGNRRVVVLSDPDVIANHALSRPDNSLLAVSLVESLRGGEQWQGEVIFDEFIHGFAPKPFHLLGILFQFPFVLVTAQMGIAVALLVWAATARFGAPLSVAPPLAAGKRSLIDTGARLLTQARRLPELSERYVEAVIADTARSLRVPVAQVPDLPAPAAALTPEQIWQWRKKLLGESRAHTKLD